MEKKSYAGSIQHSGAQKVNAPYGDQTKKGKSNVKRGEDLRTGKK